MSAHELRHGDCLDVLASLAPDSVDAVVTEPSAAQAGSVYNLRQRTHEGAFYADSGGASRFFYCAKASRAERDAGCEGFDKRPLLWSSGTENPGSFQSEGTEKAARNHHPTVKPLALMRWLVRLVTPPCGLVLDPFAGSGTTGVACVHESRQFLGIEREAEYVAIARARIQYVGGAA
jgi:DNA modification methylase